jgi:hypothetical protein
VFISKRRGDSFQFSKAVSVIISIFQPADNRLRRLKQVGQLFLA